MMKLTAANWETDFKRRKREQVLIVVNGNNNDDSDYGLGVKRGRKFVGWNDNNNNLRGPSSTLVLARTCPTSGKRASINDVTFETSVLESYLFALVQHFNLFFCCDVSM